MNYNLIDEKWIPVKRKDGTTDRIAPWEMTTDYENNPVIALNAPRPDFNGALIQFLIGLVQTTIAPANPIEWKHKLKNPPTREQLKSVFMGVHDAFELGGDGPRFMQDYEDFKKKLHSIDWLLIGAATENTLKDNIDHFTKRNAVPAMCPSCSAMALMSIQTNAPSGGRGYRTSLRGGGPLTTLILGDDLYDTVWLNVLDAISFKNMCNSATQENFHAFPWLSHTVDLITEQDIHPAQYFWATPRRIRLILDGLSSGICSLCSKYSDELVINFKETNHGTEYKAPMKHPLSPYNGRTQKAILCSPGGTSYRHWLGLIIDDADGNSEPARIVHEFINERQDSDMQYRLWAFGYDFVPGQNKARCWYDSKMPLITVGNEFVPEYETRIAQLIKAATIICSNLKIAIKRVLQGLPVLDKQTKKVIWKYADIKKLPNEEEKILERLLNSLSGQSLFMSVEASFWQITEPTFYSILHNLAISVREKKDASNYLEEWHQLLCKEALELFDLFILRAPIEDLKIKHIALAREDLDTTNRRKKVRQVLGLP